jgi:S-DNA-T family DNA segregation ATPase FtsK/SpoIIIE
MTKLDEHFEEAARMIVLNQRGSTSDLQRRLGLGYARAGKLMDQLEAAGIVGPQSGSKPREILVSDFAELDGILDAYLQR